MDSAPAAFDRNRYVVLKSLIGDIDLAQTYRYVCAIADAGLMKSGDRLVPGAPYRYGDPMMEDLLVRLQPAIEHASGLQLFPTYSYVRLYKHGDHLERHTDRESCEISVTLCLGMNPGEPWPIHVEGPHGTSSIDLAPGDALMYRGIECAHWRDAYAGDRLGQLFLHYVDQHGPYAEWKFDRRPSLSDLDSWNRGPDRAR